MQPSARNAFYRLITCQNRELKPVTSNQPTIFRQSIAYLSEDHLDGIIDDEEDDKYNTDSIENPINSNMMAFNDSIVNTPS
jgi:hypothetical protein